MVSVVNESSNDQSSSDVALTMMGALYSAPSFSKFTPSWMSFIGTLLSVSLTACISSRIYRAAGFAAPSTPIFVFAALFLSVYPSSSVV